MQVEYTSHALERLRSRGISKTLVKEAIIRGQKRESQPDGTTKLTYVKNRTKLVVVYQLTGRNKSLIITAYYAD